jgi:hypothetical protein
MDVLKVMRAAAVAPGISRQEYLEKVQPWH